MQNEHTPGPWRVRKDWLDGEFRQAIVASHAGANQGHRPYPRDIARLVDWSESWETTEEQAANARIIAAAPDMLEALQAIVQWEDDESRHSGDLMAIIGQARSAAAKATGKE